MVKLLSGGFKVLTLLILFTFLSSHGFAESFWQGSITTANYGDLPEEGLYGASNAFPLNTDVVVTNPKNGKTVEVTIMKRLGNATVFLALSDEAGKSIGVSRGEIINGTMSLKASGEDEIVQSADSAYNDGPEENPGFKGESEELSLIKEYIKTELGGENPENRVSDSKAEPALPESKVIESESPEDQVPELSMTEEKENETAPIPEHDIPVISELKQGSPLKTPSIDTGLPVPSSQIKDAEMTEIPEAIDLSSSEPETAEKRIFRTDVLPALSSEEKDMPEVLSMIAYPEEKTFTPRNMAVPDIYKTAEKQDKDRPDVITAEITEAESGTPVSSFLAYPELKPEVSSAGIVETKPSLSPEKPAETVSSLPVSGEVEIVLEPAKPKPPSSEKTAVDTDAIHTPEKMNADMPVDTAINRPAAEVSIPSAGYSFTTELEKGAYYLQLGAYVEEFSAKDLAETLAGRYPVTVLVGRTADTSSYKVMVGPLNQDESGSLLFNFRAKGYKDAFLRKGIK